MGKKNYKNDRDFEKEYLKARQKELGEAFYSLLYRAYLKTDWTVYDKKNDQRDLDVKEEDPLTEEELTNILNDYLKNSEHKENYAGLFNRIIDTLDEKIIPFKDEVNKLEREEVDRVNEISSKINDLKDMLEKNQNIYADEFEEASRQLHEARIKLEYHRNRINDPSVVEEKTKKFDDLYNEMKDNVSKFDETISNLESERDKEIKEINDKIDEGINNLTTQRKEYEREELDFYDDLYNTNNELESLNAKIKDYETGAVRKDYEQIVSELSSDCEIRNGLQEEFSGKRRYCERIKEQMKEYDSLVKAMDEITLDNFAKKLTAENNELKAQMYSSQSSYKKDEKDIAALKEKIKKLEPEVNAYINTVGTYRGLSEESKNSTGYNINNLKSDYDKYMQNEAKYIEMQTEYIKAKSDLSVIEVRHEEEQRKDAPYKQIYLSNQQYINEYKADKANRERYIKRQGELGGYQKLKELLNKIKSDLEETKNYKDRVRSTSVAYIVLSLANLDKENNKLVLKDEYMGYSYKGENPIENLIDAYAKEITNHEIKEIDGALVPYVFGDVSVIDAITDNIDKYITSLDRDINDIEEFKKKDPVSNYKKYKLKDYYELEAQYNNTQLEMKKLEPRLTVWDNQVKKNADMRLRIERELDNLKTKRDETTSKLNEYKQKVLDHAKENKEFVQKRFEFKNKVNVLITLRDNKLKEIDDKYSKLLVDAKAQKDNYVNVNKYDAYNKIALNDNAREKTEFILNEEKKTLDDEEKLRKEELDKIKKLNIALEKRNNYEKGEATLIKEQIEALEEQKNRPNTKLANAIRKYNKAIANKNLFLTSYKERIESESLENEVYGKSKIANSIRHLAEGRENKNALGKMKYFESEKSLIHKYTDDANKLISDALPNLAYVEENTTTLADCANMYDYAKDISEDKEAYYNEKLNELSYDSIIARSYKENPRDVISYFDNPNNKNLSRDMKNNHLFFCSNEYKDFERDLRVLSTNPENKEELMDIVRQEAKIYLDKKFALDQNGLKDITKRRMTFALDTIAKIDAYKRAKDDDEVINDRVNIEINLDDNVKDNLNLAVDEADELNNAFVYSDEEAAEERRQFNKPEKIK